MKTKTVKDNRWTRPGKMSREAFLAGISEAESGHFSNFDDHKKRLTAWFEHLILKQNK